MTEQTPDSQPTSNDPVLLAAVLDLATQVKELKDELTVSKKQNRRQRQQFWAILLIFVIVVVGGYRNTTHIKDAQVRSCENANNSRQGNITLWTTIVGLSAVGTDDPNQKAALAALLDWITELNRPRDCNDLNRKYETPPPPDFTQFIPDHPVSGNSP